MHSSFVVAIVLLGVCATCSEAALKPGEGGIPGKPFKQPPKGMTTAKKPKVGATKKMVTKHATTKKKVGAAKRKMVGTKKATRKVGSAKFTTVSSKRKTTSMKPKVGNTKQPSVITKKPGKGGKVTAVPIVGKGHRTGRPPKSGTRRHRRHKGTRKPFTIVEGALERTTKPSSEEAQAATTAKAIKSADLVVEAQPAPEASEISNNNNNEQPAEKSEVCWKVPTLPKVPECIPGHEKDGSACYPICKDGFIGIGAVCWTKCKKGFADQGAICSRNAKLISSDNSQCPWYDICGLTFARGCSKCPSSVYTNEGCTCRIDPATVVKESYTRTATSETVVDAQPVCQAKTTELNGFCWPDCPRVLPADFASILCSPSLDSVSAEVQSAADCVANAQISTAVKRPSDRQFEALVRQCLAKAGLDESTPFHFCTKFNKDTA